MEISPSDRPGGADAELFRLLVESVKDYAIFLLTPEGRVATWNAGAEAIKGYRATEIIGQHFSRFYEADALARGWPQHELALATANGRFEDEGWRVRKDGSRFWASVVITALRGNDGTLAGFAKVTRDLTARRQVEELQRAERRLNEFLAMLAHELRNPLAPMRTALDLAARAPRDEGVQEYARDLLSRQLEHLTRLVDDILDVSRITRGKVTLKLESLDLNEVLRTSAENLRPLLASRGQSLALSLPQTPTPILADPTRIMQIVANLLSNAHRYGVDNGRVTLALRHDGDAALFEISDNGIGIAPHLLPLIFDPFVQGERGLDRPEGGLGIGLTLVKRLVEMHGGSVAATSGGVGCGSTFSVRLPMHAPAPPRAASNDATASTSQKLRVLVVDDNDDVARSTALLLGMLGHDVDVASDGLQAIERATATAPDVVLLDIGLPRMDGYEVARALRLLPRLRNATLVACTGYGRDDDRERALAAGFDRHAVKPVGLETLTSILVDASARIASGSSH